MNLLLAGDIGGTKTQLGLFYFQDNHPVLLKEGTFVSANYAGLAPLVTEFLKGQNMAVQGACFGVAGPVREGRADLTHLPWVVDERQLASALSIDRVVVINDLMTIAEAIPWLAPQDLFTLNVGTPNPGGTMAVIAPGTGLGEAFVIRDGDTTYRVAPSQGGHTDFAPNTSLEMDLLQYLRPQAGHVSYENVCSGLGIRNLYRFLKETGQSAVPSWFEEQLAGCPDPTPLIIEAALNADRSCPIARDTLELFLSILGAEAGNLALKVLATGGVFLGGGIPPRILPALRKGPFLISFFAKGPMSPLMTGIPVHVILNRQAALFGAAIYGCKEWEFLIS
jgi:glucokinase